MPARGPMSRYLSWVIGKERNSYSAGVLVTSKHSGNMLDIRSATCWTRGLESIIASALLLPKRLLFPPARRTPVMSANGAISFYRFMIFSSMKSASKTTSPGLNQGRSGLVLTSLTIPISVSPGSCIGSS